MHSLFILLLKMSTTYLMLYFCLLHYYSSYSCVFMVALSYWWMCLHTYRSSWRYKLTVKWGLWERLLWKVNTSFFVLFSLKSRLSHSRKPFVPGLTHIVLSSSRHACPAALDLCLISLAANKAWSHLSYPQLVPSLEIHQACSGAAKAWYLKSLLPNRFVNRAD